MYLQFCQEGDRCLCGAFAYKYNAQPRFYKIFMTQKRLKTTRNSRTYFTALRRSALLFLLAGIVHADLKTSIDDVSTQTAKVSASVTSLSQSQATLINSYKLTNAVKSSLLVAGVSSGTAGGSVVVPLSFIKGPSQATAVQTEFVVPSSFTLTGVVIGPAGTSANKSVQFSVTAGVARIILFGLNTDVIGSGVVANMTLKSIPTTPKGVYKIPLRNSVSSDAAGSTLLILETSGAIVL